MATRAVNIMGKTAIAVMSTSANQAAKSGYQSSTTEVVLNFEGVSEKEILRMATNYCLIAIQGQIRAQGLADSIRNVQITLDANKITKESVNDAVMTAKPLNQVFKINENRAKKPRKLSILEKAQLELIDQEKTLDSKMTAILALWPFMTDQDRAILKLSLQAICANAQGHALDVYNKLMSADQPAADQAQNEESVVNDAPKVKIKKKAQAA